MASKRRLAHVAQSLASPRPVIGTLKLGEIQYEVSEALTPTRLPHCAEMGLLDTSHPFNADNLHFMLQKYLLGQDVFLVSQPGPYARRLAMTFASIINAEYEYLALHRDVGETELKQGREIRSGGNLVYVDSAAVRAAKHGRLLILEGIEKAERGIMPVLNNLLENREMNLDDGSLIVHPQKYAQLEAERPPLVNGKVFIPAHKAFRVIAIAAPVPPYPGYPLDPPFRSRFQARFIDPVGALLALSNSSPSASTAPPFFQKIRDIILSTQYASENRHALESISKSTLPPFPQTALAKLKSLTEKFPPPSVLSSGQLARVFLVLHPALAHAPFQAWAMLSRQSEEAELGELGSPATSDSNEDIGIFGYRIANIVRISEWRVRLTFDCPSGRNLVVVDVPAGRNSIRPFPFQGKPEFQVTKRFLGLLTCLLQGHALGKDISLIPPVSPSTASCSTSTLLRVFSEVLGYDMEAVHVYKELGGREIIMRRNIEESGATSWQPSPLVSGAYSGKLVHLDGLDVSGATGGSLARFMQDREIELWEGKRIVGAATEQETTVGELSVAHPSLRIVTTASKSSPLKDWLSDEHANMFFPIPSQPMDEVEEEAILLQTGCLSSITQSLLSFAGRYRSSIASDEIQRNRKLGTRALVRIAKLFAKFPRSIDLHAVLSRTLLADFLPAVEKINLNALLLESGILKSSPAFNPSPNVVGSKLIFPESNSSSNSNSSFELISIPLFDAAEDREGVASHVPHMDHFYDNSLQTGLMRDLAIDIEVLGEHVVLLGNQGVGKNKIVDRICQLLGRPREYIQLHRDSTVNQLMFTTSLEGGVIKYTDSPLLRAITHGRIILIDEADKAPEHVVAIFRSLASHGEMTLSDGRRVRAVRERPDDIVVHPNFRLVLLANRPGYPFLGNHFLQVLGDNFSCHAISNPDQASERKLLSQLAPEIDEDILLRLVGAFQDLRQGYDSGTLTYPYSLRELINLVRHMQSFPTDFLSTALRNVFDFDIYKTDTIDKLAEILRHHGLNAEKLGLDAARETAEKKRLDLKFEPTDSTGLKEPKEGEHDARYNPHVGGNRWAGGSGGRDTAGSGGRGGYKRLQKGHSIHQVSDQLKDEVPEHIKKHAREMAREEFLRRLEELDMSVGDAAGYGELLTGVQAHIASLHDLLEHLAAKEEERVWFKRQTDGELDDSRLTEGLTGEQSVYKRRGMGKPELGRPQIKPKRIRFIFDISGSMYRFQHDGRLKRSLETAVMLMESFERVSRKDKYTWDMYGHSGDEPLIPLVDAGKYPVNVRDRWKVVEKMHLVTQYAFSGDYTVEAIDKGVVEVSKFDADDWFVVAITDANFGRYQITPDEVKRVMLQNPKVHTALICIGEGAEVPWITKELPGRAFRVFNTTDIPIVLCSILSTMIDR